MSLFGLFILCVILLVPVSWLVAEFRGPVGLRIALGLASVVVTCAMTLCAGVLFTRFDQNVYYGLANQHLIDATVAGIEQGRSDKVVRELKRLREAYEPTYENRARYDSLVEETVKRLQGPE